MISFTLALIALIVGYVTYGALVNRLFGVDPQKETPCYTRNDGIDYTPMPTWKVFLIQFLNIAGTGPIFGAIMGILFGPAAYLWIVLGCIFIGAVHDYLCGMISLRENGASLPEMVGDSLGNVARQAMRVLSIILLVLVGTVFVTTSAGLLATMTGGNMGYDIETWKWIWIGVVFIYCILATLLPIDALIGKLYPLFGSALLIMAIGVGMGIYVQDGWLPELTDAPFATHHPSGLPIFPFLCITIACGAVSGFHATQSPLMSRCLKNERHGRMVFYGAMITEGIVALIWAAAAIKFAGSYEHLSELMTSGGKSNPSLIVNMICSTWMGRIGAILAVLGVVAAPITSSDTAYRSARLIVADFLHMGQHRIWHRLILALPLFALSALLVFIDFDVLWRYFAWFNQTLATCFLWTAAVWLSRQGKCYWMAYIPALFMTVVCVSYILVAPKEGFGLSLATGLTAGLATMLCLAILFKVKRPKS